MVMQKQCDSSHLPCILAFFLLLYSFSCFSTARPKEDRPIPGQCRIENKKIHLYSVSFGCSINATQSRFLSPDLGRNRTKDRERRHRFFSLISAKSSNDVFTKICSGIVLYLGNDINDLERHSAGLGSLLRLGRLSSFFRLLAQLHDLGREKARLEFVVPAVLQLTESVGVKRSAL